jgi:hypothetical protein
VCVCLFVLVETDGVTVYTNYEIPREEEECTPQIQSCYCFDFFKQ